MRRALVVGNWKMNGTRDSVRQLLADLKAGLDAGKPVDVAVCAPFVFISDVAEQLKGSPIAVGAQNVADQKSGAFTGEISPAMLVEFGARYAIVGHSERRAVYGETDALVAARYAQAIEGGVIPILCVGETLEQRESGDTFKVVKEQLDAVLGKSGVQSLGQAVIAYEPVWAIGTGKTATSQQAQEVHEFIRSEIRKLDAAVAEKVQILYGGSVKADNAAELFAMADIDGGLIGGASLDPKAFLTICHAVG